jgi:transposase
VRSGEDQLSLTDPDARAMHPNMRIGVGYNVQLAVDARHKLIAEQQVHAKVSDLGLLTVTATAARDNLGVARIEAVADGGYFKTDDLEACEAAGIVPNVPRPERSTAARKGLFAKTRFRYQPQSDTYLCPGGAHLDPLYCYERRGSMTIDYLDRNACRHCTLKARCTTDLYRKIVRHEHEAVQERMAERLAARPS